MQDVCLRKIFDRLYLVTHTSFLLAFVVLLIKCENYYLFENANGRYYRIQKDTEQEDEARRAWLLKNTDAR